MILTCHKVRQRGLWTAKKAVSITLQSQPHYEQFKSFNFHNKEIWCQLLYLSPTQPRPTNMRLSFSPNSMAPTTRTLLEKRPWRKGKSFKAMTKISLKSSRLWRRLGMVILWVTIDPPMSLMRTRGISRASPVGSSLKPSASLRPMTLLLPLQGGILGSLFGILTRLWQCPKGWRWD